MSVKTAWQLLDDALQLLKDIEAEMPPRQPLRDHITSWKRDHADWIRWAVEPITNLEREHP